MHKILFHREIKAFVLRKNDMLNVNKKGRKKAIINTYLYMTAIEVIFIYSKFIYLTYDVHTCHTSFDNT